MVHIAYGCTNGKTDHHWRKQWWWWRRCRRRRNAKISRHRAHFVDWLVVKGVWGEGRMGTPKRAPLSVGTFFYVVSFIFFNNFLCMVKFCCHVFFLCFLSFVSLLLLLLLLKWICIFVVVAGSKCVNWQQQNIKCIVAVTVCICVYVWRSGVWK